MRSKTPVVLLVCSLVLTGLLFQASPAAAQAEESCFRPEGIAEAPTPSITAGEVAANPTPENIKTFALEARNYGQGLDHAALAYAICHFKQEGGDWKSGSIYITSLTFLAGGRVEIHAGNMAFGGRKVREDVFMAVAAATGWDPATQTFTNRDGGALPEALGGYAVGMQVDFGGIPFPLIMTAGLDLQETHLVHEIFDPADAPAVTASEVVDRETLKAFVNGAIEHFGNLLATGGIGALTQSRAVFRDERGPWREGSVYLFTLDASGYVWFHGAFPHQFEFVVARGRYIDAVTGEPIFPKIIEAAESDPEGAFVEYHFDDPADDSDSADIPKTAFVRRHTYPGFPLPFIFGSGFYTRTGPPGTMTQFVPVVLDSRGKNNSHFTSELALTNRSSDPAMLNFTYTAEAGGGSGAATDMLGPHQQMIATKAIDYLRDLGVPIPETGSRVGTLRVDVSGSSEVSAVVRTTTPTAVPEGRAGLAYLGVPENEGFHEEAVYLCGLREHPGDRSNVALQNMGSEGSITLRTTVYSGDPTDPIGEMLNDMTLGPGEFHQFNAVLQTAGKSGHIGATFGGGYVKVERVEGTAPFYAYGVINDNANSDGSFVFPVSAGSLEGAMGLTLPALVEINQFTTELTLTNVSGQPKVLMFSATHEKFPTENNTAGFGPVPLLPGQQFIIPDALEFARRTYQLDVPTGVVTPLAVQAVGGDVSGIVIGARVVAPADAQDPSKGQYGVFYTAVPHGMGFTGSAWVDGLQQNEENRSNLALINTGEMDGSDSVFELDIYDGETAMKVKTVTMAEEPLTMVPAKGFRQINGILARHAPGTTQGYVRIRKVSGANPFLAYGVVNDGGTPGERTGDGAYIPARE